MSQNVYGSLFKLFNLVAHVKVVLDLIDFIVFLWFITTEP